MRVPAAGHIVTVATHEISSLVTGDGLAFASMAGDPEAIVAAADRWLVSGRLRISPGHPDDQAAGHPAHQRLLADYWRVAPGSEVLIYSAVAEPVWSVAERPGSHRQALLQPLHRTRSFPMIRVPTTLSLGARFNEATYLATQELAWQLVHGPHPSLAPGHPRAAAGARRGPFGSTAGGSSRPSIYGYSPRVVRRPADWGPRFMSRDTGRCRRTAPGGRPRRSAHFYRPARRRSMWVSGA